MKTQPSHDLDTTTFFERRVRKFLAKHPDLRPRFVETMERLRADPFDPKLWFHALSGKFQGIHGVSLTSSYRITLILQITEHETFLLDIGSHDEVYW